jgi:hypothetical protein
MFIAFDGSRTARWAAGDVAARGAAQLTSLRDGLLAVVGQAAQVPGGSGEMRGSSIPVFQAESLAGWQQVAPPTASGFLLGYPAAYLCRGQEDAQQASRYLSSSSLSLHAVNCQLQLPPGMPALEAEQPLLAFSVPADLMAAPEWQACLTSWEAYLHVQHQLAQQQGLPWSRLCVTTKQQPPRPVAL